MNQNREMSKRIYKYEGPVMLFDKTIINNWKGETYTVSEARARSNLAFQLKTKLGKVPSSAIKLPGKLTIIE